MKKRKSRRQIRRERQRITLLIIAFLALITVIGVAVGSKIGAERRTEIADSLQEEAINKANAEASKKKAEEEAQAAYAAEKAAEEAAAAHQKDYRDTQQLLSEQTKAANREETESLKRLGIVGIANVSAHAASLIAPPVEITGHVVCIDAGHEHVDLMDSEPIAPGSSEMKQKVSSGTYGEASGLEEYELNLMVALKLQAVLEARGYTVIMTRTDHEVQLSNIDRAVIANESGAEIMIRVHANSVDDTGVTGALTFGPADDNPYLSAELIAESKRLGMAVIDAFCASTGARNRGFDGENDLTGINWTKIPCTYIEMGFMSNPEEDLLMADDNYQNLMAEGLANGIDAYFAGN